MILYRDKYWPISHSIKVVQICKLVVEIGFYFDLDPKILIQGQKQMIFNLFYQKKIKSLIFQIFFQFSQIQSEIFKIFASLWIPS